jgi:putative restriction endonuclease
MAVGKEALAGADWSEAVEIAVARLAGRLGQPQFTLRQLVEEELPRIVRETGSRGATPEATLRRELQELRDRDGIEFLGRGLYRLKAMPLVMPMALPSKCAFVIGSTAMQANEDRFYRFDPQWLNAATRSVGEWILYRQPPGPGSRGYYAVARVEQIVRDPVDPAKFRALMAPGSYLEFGRDVPAQAGAGKGEPIRPISDAEFNRIVGLGLVEDDEVLPREDADEPMPERVHEGQEEFLGAIERETVLTERKVRDRQFRKRVIEAYDCRCALTGMRLINGGGRAEVQAAHIMSVEAGGPDRETNGIALSGTVHWMFDRGLISLSDAGDILLSSKINDVESVEKLIRPDRRAILPANGNLRPHPRYLAWHREWHQFAAWPPSDH